MDRLQGYKDALRGSDLLFKEEYIIREEFLRKGWQEAVKKLRTRTIPPSALFVTDELMALGVVNFLTEMQMDIPEQVSIVSFNNALFAEMSRHKLTSIDINIEELGYQAARSLIQLLKNENEPIKRIIIPYKLVIRHSCSKPNRAMGADGDL